MYIHIYIMLTRVMRVMETLKELLLNAKTDFYTLRICFVRLVCIQFHPWYNGTGTRLFPIENNSYMQHDEKGYEKKIENEPADSRADGISIGFRFRLWTLLELRNFHTESSRVQWPIFPNSETLLIMERDINIQFFFYLLRMPLKSSLQALCTEFVDWIFLCFCFF